MVFLCIARLCTNPYSVPPNEWSKVITKWPVSIIVYITQVIEILRYTVCHSSYVTTYLNL